ncbi:Antitoxin component of toxin-antitoxin stability system, DNA-binding transcriptional repressor [bacterium JGI 053]|nr:Antitoxin component of toxin-antitoxin stability system, DNA-binding transcriptional repressor [bacterium JGI 053]
MRIVDVEAAQADLDGLIDLARSGEEIVIARDETPVARLVAIRREPGVLKGFVLPDTFFDPLPDEELDAWEQ